MGVKTFLLAVTPTPTLTLPHQGEGNLLSGHES